MKVEAIEYGDRKVYSVAAFNRGVAVWLARLPTVWVEGEVTELRRQDALADRLLHAQGPAGRRVPRRSRCRAAQFDALRLDLADGERVHVYGRPELSRRAASSACGRSRSSASASATTSPRSSG